MPEIMLSGTAGRLECRYNLDEDLTTPVALLLHPHPLHGGSMNNKVVHAMHRAFRASGFGTVRFNFRGVGRSLGSYGHGEGEIADAATVLDWIQSQRDKARAVWIGGYSFGAWISMQLLMRRPEIASYVSVSPPVNRFDFSFLAPCPTAGLIVYGTKDVDVPASYVLELKQYITNQRVADVATAAVDCDHFYTDRLDILENTVKLYVETHLDNKTTI